MEPTTLPTPRTTPTHHADRAPSLRVETRGTPFESDVLQGPHEAEAALEGRLPEWLSGRLLRTAPAVLELGSFRASHWFDGLGMLYRFDLRAGRVRFAQRLMETEALAEARAGQWRLAAFGTRLRRGFFERLVQPIPRFTDNANVHVVPLPEGWLAMTETPRQLLVEPESLAVSPYRYTDALGSLSAMLAHPELDPGRGELVNLATRLGPKVELVAYSQRLGEAARRPFGSFQLPDLPYLHSFGLTPTKMVVVAGPLVANPLSMLWSNRGYVEHFRWRPELGTRVFVVDRRSGTVECHETPAFFTFHVAAAFDEGDEAVVDLVAYDDADIVERVRWPALLDGFSAEGRLRRVRVSSAGVRVETLDAQGLEFPVIDRRRALGRRPEVVFGARLQGGDGRFSSWVRRIELPGGAARAFHRDGVVYGEPVFVANPGSDREGDGVLLAVGSDLERRGAELVVLDATSLEPLATARVDHPVPLGFHGSFRRDP